MDGVGLNIILNIKDYFRVQIKKLIHKYISYIEKLEFGSDINDSLKPVCQTQLNSPNDIPAPNINIASRIRRSISAESQP